MIAVGHRDLFTPSIIVVSNFLVLSSEHLFCVVCGPHIVRGSRASEKTFELEKSIATRNLTNYDLL